MLLPTQMLRTLFVSSNNSTTFKVISRNAEEVDPRPFNCWRIVDLILSIASSRFGLEVKSVLLSHDDDLDDRIKNETNRNDVNGGGATMQLVT